MRIIRILLTIIILATANLSFSQIKRIGIPYSKQYTGIDYEASNQNWCSIKDNRGIMYFANTNGTLVFDGSNWNVIKTPTNAAVKSLAIDSANNIYVGAKGDFGVLKTSENGSLEFQSLTDKIPDDYANFADIWSIVIDQNEGIIFEATSALYILKNDSISVIPAEANSGFRSVFSTGNRIFAVSITSGIKEIVNGKLTDAPHLADAGSTITLIEEYKNKLNIINYKQGVYIYQDDTLIKIEKEINDIIRNDLYCARITHDGNFLFGTLSHGLIVTDSKFNIIKKVDIRERITSVYEDNNNLVWVTSANGITMIDLYSPFSSFPNTLTGISGAIRSILQVGDELYLGADAVFHIKTDSLSNPKFREIKNTKGRNSIWKLDTINGVIIGGGEMGLFSIDSNNILHNIDKTSTRNIRNFVTPNDNPNLLIAGGGLGLSIYENKNGTWEYRNGPYGFNEYARHIMHDADGNFWVSDKSKGVFKLKFNDTYDTISYQKYNSQNGLPADIENYLFDTGNKLTIGTLSGFYKYDPDSNIFVEDTNLNTAFGGKKTFDFMYNDHKGNLWVKHVIANKRDDNIKYWFLECYTLTSDTTAQINADQFRPYMSHINSFGYIGNNCYIIGDKDGFVHFDRRISKLFNYPYKALIRKIENIYNDSLIYGGNGDDKKIVLPYSQHSVRITFSATSYEHPENIKFKSYLENNDDEWSDFRSENYKEYPNLSPGTYKLHVVAINSYNIESEEAIITFQILAPWYLTKWAIVIYIILFGLMIWSFIKIYTKKLVRDKQKLEQIVQDRTKEIRAQSKLIMEKNEEIVQKNKSITDSINYARHIQRAMLPLDEKIKAALPEYFILFRPKDIVSGDYYWFAETETSIIITAADCTGHGVPGAFMSMIGSQILTEIVAEGITSPEQILTNQNRRIRKALKQDTTENQDGMDMALCTINKETHLVEYAGAKNQLIVIQNNELTEYKADKQGIGGSQMYGQDFQYKKIGIQPDGNTWFYMFSDGYKDQFGGPSNTKFLIKNLRALLLKIHNETPEKQREILNDTIEKWIQDGHTEQTDDIILLGFKL